MSDPAEETPKKVRRGRRVETYHGTRLAPARDTPNFTVEEIREAVEKAIAKNLHLLTARK